VRVIKKMKRTKKHPIGFYPTARQEQVKRPKPKPSQPVDTRTPSGKRMPY